VNKLIKLKKIANKFSALFKAQTYTALNQTSTDENTLTSIKEFFENKEWEELDSLGHHLLDQNPPNAKLIELIIYYLQQSDNLKKYANLSKKAILLFPKEWIFYFFNGLALYELGDYLEARISLENSLVLYPEFDQSLNLLTKTVSKLEGLEKAKLVFNNHLLHLGRGDEGIIVQIETVRCWAKKRDIEVFLAGDVEKLIYRYPRVWGLPHNDKIIHSQSNKPYVVKIPNARIFGNSSIILTEDNVALSDTGGHANFGQFVNFIYEKNVIAQAPGKLLMAFNLYNQKLEIAKGIFLSGLASNAFGHWLPEFLPKLQFFQQHPEYCNTPIIVDIGMPESHFDLLRKISKNPLITISSNQQVFCKELLVAPSPTFFPTEVFPNTVPPHEMMGVSIKAMNFLRDSQKLKPISYRKRRIFLGRRNMKWRKLINEKEIELYLNKLEFETVFMEDLKASQQIELFQTAEWIVAPNGSALNNLIFSEIDTKVIVLCQANLFNWGSFYGPMEALGYNTICVCGDSTSANAIKHSDYAVPIDSIKNALLELGMSEVNLTSP
jgi:tetratricopeptide (TPR) repeat protein